MTDFANLRREMCRLGIDPGPYDNETLKQLVMICDRFMSQREAALKELQDLGEEFDRDAALGKLDEALRQAKRETLYKEALERAKT